MFRFQRYSIKWQLVFTNMFIAVSTLLVSLLIIYSYNRDALRQRIVRELTLLAEPIGLNNTATLKFHKQEDAISSLGVLRGNDNVEIATLLYPDGRVFVEYFYHDIPLVYDSPEEIPDGYRFIKDKLEVFRAIEVDGLLFGYIYIRSNMNDLEVLRNDNIRIALVVILASSLFAFLVAFYLEKLISVPVARLASTAKRIGDSRDFSIRVEQQQGDNEVAELYGAFNTMLGQIEAQNAELRSAFEFLMMQKEEIKQQHRDITDSINSARNLQKIILPQLRSVKRIVKDAFVFFRPKDILSGDFYWFARKGNWTFIAAVDCVGHGIPGALLSIVADNWLNKIIVERTIIDPSEILNRLDRSVTRSLRNGSGSTRSMDIALMAINFYTHELRFAGAYNPLYIVRKGELIELKADRCAIGTLKEHKDLRSYTTQRIKLQTGDMLYVFSDGFADQFGGVENKKFKFKAFRELLKKISDLPTNEQEEKLEETFQRWRGLNEQVDDILVMGVRVPARVTEMLPFKHR